jgi:salicylate hydroxylase
MSEILVAGGGIGGLAAALACGRAGARVRLFERAAAFAEVGAGVQLGPNAVRVLDGWGLTDELRRVASFPERLRVRDAASGRALGQLQLGAAMHERYGQPYATVHRADLHGLLLRTAQAEAGVTLTLGASLERFEDGPHQVRACFADGAQADGDALIGCDGVWSKVRQQLLHDGPPRVTGHLAFRAVVPQAPLPPSLRSLDVTVWLGPRLHVVQYPVRGGEWLNVVAVIEGHSDRDAQGWDHGGMISDVRRAMGRVCAPLGSLIDAIALWRFWVLQDRAPLRAPSQYLGQRVTLLGDAAHPMRPYQAQGAAMALEDAQALGLLLAGSPQDPVAVIGRYAQLRCPRNARVQLRSERNGRIFHLDGIVRSARDAAMRVLGEGLLDTPWLYSGPPAPG